MPTSSTSVRPTAGVVAGLIAGAATAGILVGLGLRHGTALQPFAGAGRVLLHGAASRLSERSLAIGGTLLHFALACLAGMLTANVARRLGGRVLAASFAVAGLAWMASGWILPESFRAITADLSRGEQFLFFSVLGITLWAGIRLALTDL